MKNKHAASFRDPDGFIFSHNGEIHRQITPRGLTDYKAFMASGLYSTLVGKKYLIPHEELDQSLAGDGLTIKPEQLTFISQPYEWCFAQLKDAALLTLYSQMEALKAGFSLKDATAYNVQFHNGRPVFIDTLSFEPYDEGKPWVAYKQFCQHFLAPLALAAHVDVRSIKLFQNFIDGVPLDLASAMLKGKKRFDLGLLTHIHWHAKTQLKYADKQTNSTKSGNVSKMGMLGLIDNLTGAIKKLKWNPAGTEWGDYYSFTNYNDDSFQHKKEIVQSWLSEDGPALVWDLGANDGTFSSLASAQGRKTVAWDIDPIAVEKNYRRSRKDKEANMLPLILDLTNPSPAIGWGHTERQSLEQRGPADTVMALAIIHHLAISNNVPLERIAEYFAKLGKTLIIEFVPKGDSQVNILLATREDIFDQYDESGFEKAFTNYFTILQKEPVRGTKRTMYHLKANG
ncbi:MAG: SAM-dependent methyltransferase [Flavobacteriales bacterium]|nr:SAM-dependent methyltransferase [Flavobacteriales bacterium]